jgi:hypothetical protein
LLAALPGILRGFGRGAAGLRDSRRGLRAGFTSRGFRFTIHQLTFTDWEVVP